MRPVSLPNGTVGQFYNKTITASGGSAPYIFTVSSGSLPPSLTLSTSGVLSGTFTAEGTFTFTILATDSHGCTGKRQYIVTAKCPLITLKPVNLSNGTVGQPYSRTIVAVGGNAPYTFTLEVGSLPTGLTLSATGVLSGTPTSEGTFTFTILATDRYGCTGKRDYTISIKCAEITVSPVKLSSGTVNHPYSKTITADGGSGPYLFIVELGKLPDGLNLSTGGVLSGTPTADGDFTFTILATDRYGCSGKRNYNLTIYGCPAITIKPFTFSNATVGLAYNRGVVASGGVGPYTFTLLNGSLPAGLTLSTGGAVSGTPTASGNYSFTILATDSFSCTGKRQYTLTVNCPTITLAPSTLANGVVGQPYNKSITASGGSWPYTFTVANGNLPAGLTLSSSGILSGTPTGAGFYPLTILAKDHWGCTGTRSYNLIIFGH